MSNDLFRESLSAMLGLWKREPNGVVKPQNGKDVPKKEGSSRLLATLILGAAITGTVGAVIASRRRSSNGAVNGGVAKLELLEDIKAQNGHSTIATVDGDGTSKTELEDIKVQDGYSTVVTANGNGTSATTLKDLGSQTREPMPAPVLEQPRRGGLGRFISGLKTFESLKYRNFRYLWLAQITNSASMWMEQIARPILIIDIVGDPKMAAVHVGGVLAARTFPQFGFGLIAGVMADWYDRRVLILISKFVGTVINFVFAALILTGHLELWHIYATTILRGIATSFDNPARQALIPSLVAPEHLANAVALNSASMQTMRIGAASMAGIALATIGVGNTFLAVAIIGALAVVLTYMMRIPPMPDVKDKSVTKGFGDLWEGLVFAWQTPAIRGILVLTMAYFTLGMAYLQVFAPLFAKQVLEIGDKGYGFMVSITGVGALAGSLVIATLSPSRWRGMAMLILMGGLGGLLVLFGGSTYLPFMFDDLRWVASTFAVVVFLGMAQSSYFALSNTVLLEQAPIEKRGRIMGVLSLDRSMITLGGTIAGFLSAAIGSQSAQMLFGAICILFAVGIAILMPSVRKIQ